MYNYNFYNNRTKKTRLSFNYNYNYNFYNNRTKKTRLSFNYNYNFYNNKTTKRPILPDWTLSVSGPILRPSKAWNLLSTSERKIENKFLFYYIRNWLFVSIFILLYYNL